MTLTTRFRIVEPTAVRPVFDEARRLLGAENAVFKHEQRPFFEDGTMSYLNLPGQGYAALLWVTYSPDGPLPGNEDHECYLEKNACCPPHASIEVCFDTAYAYKGANRATCNDLHAWLVQQMGLWCEARGLTWHWQNEYTGEWFKGEDGFGDFGNPDKGRLQTNPPAPAAEVAAGVPERGRRSLEV